MSNKIQELAEQARVSVPPGIEVSVWIAAYNKIFAELIVKECCDILKDTFDCHFEAEQLQEYFEIHHGSV